MKNSHLLAVSLLTVALTVAGCGKKGASSGATASKTWTNAQYHLTASYPEGWKTIEASTIEDLKTGAVRVMLWSKPGNIPNAPACERPPYVKILYTPTAKAQMPDLPLGIQNPQSPPGAANDPDAQNRVMGVPTESGGLISGWNESGGKNVQTKKIKIAEGIDAEEGTALLTQGSLLHATYTGALVGPDANLRVVLIPATTGAYEVTIVAAPDSPDWQEANQIAESLKFTK